MSASVMRAASGGRGKILFGGLVLVLGAVTPLGAVEAAEPVHPLFVANSELPRSDEAHRWFSAAAGRRRLPPVEVVDSPQPKPPQAKQLLAAGDAAWRKQDFAGAEKALRAAAAEVDETGAAGLDTAGLADLFLTLGMVLQKADWKELPTPPREITPPEAKRAYLRAAVLDRRRVLSPRRYPPLALASWALAVAEVEKRPRGSLLVRAPSSALISVDGGPAKAGILPASELVFGDHWIRVEDPGRAPWAVVVPLAEQAMEVDTPPQPRLTLDDRLAATHAKRQGANYALVAELLPGRPGKFELRLIHAGSGEREDATAVDFPGEPGALDAALMRLEEKVRRKGMEAPNVTRIRPPKMSSIAVAPVLEGPDRGPKLSDDPGAWARRRWPLLTAIGVAVGTTLVLGVVAANADGR